jgi:hypothetical protein
VETRATKRARAREEGSGADLVELRFSGKTYCRRNLKKSSSREVDTTILGGQLRGIEIVSSSCFFFFF